MTSVARGVQSCLEALWIGGAPASGKTTVASRIARRHGLRLYSADTRTWEHRDRALAAGNAAELYLLLNEVVNREAREHGAPTLTVDESRRVAETTRAVERLFSNRVGDVAAERALAPGHPVTSG